VTEFVEHWSPRRSKRQQGGGVHGNAIFSRYDFEHWVKPHTHQPIDWDAKGELMGEPREGFRSLLAALVHVPWASSKPLLVYSLHLEPFAGIIDRLHQLDDVLKDAKERVSQTPFQVISGDLNTLGHGIARFHRKFCGDGLRFRTMGFSESGWWMHHLFNQPGGSDHNPFLKKYGLSHIVNDYFFDPFHAEKDTTLQAAFGLFKGKLDWMLLRGLYVRLQGMSNLDFKSSDHRLLYCVLEPVVEANNRDPGRLAYAEGHIGINWRRNSIAKTATIVFLLSFLILIWRQVTVMEL
jgi:hypothetical protein